MCERPCFLFEDLVKKRGGIIHAVLFHETFDLLPAHRKHFHCLKGGILTRGGFFRLEDIDVLVLLKRIKKHFFR